MALALDARIYPFNHIFSNFGAAGDTGSESRFQDVLQTGEAFEFVFVVQVVSLVVQVTGSHVTLNGVAEELALESSHDPRPVLQVNVVLVVQFIWRRGCGSRSRT